MSGLRLVAFGTRHLDDVARLVSDAETIRHTRIPQPAPPGFAAEWLARYDDARRQGTREAFAIEDEAGVFLGLALAPEIERRARTIELGYMVVPEARGRGVASEALRQLTTWAFGEGAERLELVITPENVASQRVAERCGYVRESDELWARTTSGVSSSSDPRTTSASSRASGTGG